MTSKQKNSRNPDFFTSTKGKILLSAVELFSKYGYSGTSTRKLSRHVGITEGAIYRHFSSKSEILDEILLLIKDQTFQPLEPSKDEYDNKFGFLGTLMNGLPQFFFNNPNFLQISRFLFTNLHTNKKIREFIQQSFSEEADEYTKNLLKNDNSYRFSEDKIENIAQMINTYRFGWFFDTFILHSPTKSELSEIETNVIRMTTFFDNNFMQQFKI